MSFALTILLGAIAGLTIFLGLPVARLRNLSPGWMAFFNSVATGILVFLLWDILTKATEPIDAALSAARDGTPGNLILLLVLFTVGLAVGLLSLVYFETRFIRRAADASRVPDA